ncbi:hypothetical protein FACS1894185_4010 [Betaproteobacteria bacterium]|nr:hypothetical protein FACS1894185_4010 [Betaproteobacteria bacterium]
MPKVIVDTKLPIVSQKIKPVKAPDNKNSVFPHSFTLTKEQYRLILTYAAHNNLNGYEPNSASAVVRDAVDFYFSNLDETVLDELDLYGDAQ